MRHGHVLVVTTRHAGTLLDVTEAEAESLARLIRRVARAVNEAYSPIGLNVFQNNGVVSGQSIPHYHVHMLPRYSGDQPDELFARQAIPIAMEERLRIAETIAQRLKS